MTNNVTNYQQCGLHYRKPMKLASRISIGSVILQEKLNILLQKYKSKLIPRNFTYLLNKVYRERSKRSKGYCL